MTVPVPEPGVPEALSQAMYRTFVDLAPALGMAGRFVSYDRLSPDDRILANAMFSSFIQRGLIVPGPNLVPDPEVVARRTAPVRRHDDTAGT